MTNFRQSAAERDTGEEISSFLSDLTAKTLFDMCPESIWIHQQGIVVYANQALAHMLRYDDTREIVGRKILEFAPAEFRESLHEQIVSSGLAGGPAPESEFLLERADGSRICVEVSNSRLPDGEKNLVIAYIRDISLRKQADQALSEQKIFLQNVINMTAEPIFVKDSKSHFILVNEACCLLVEKPREEIIGRTLAENISETEMAHFLAVDRRVLETGVPESSEEQFTTPSGITRTLLTRKSCYMDEQGKKFLVGVMHDLTERKQNEAKNRLSQEQYKATLDAIPDLLFEMDIDGRYHECHSPKQELLAAPREILIGKRVSEVLPPDASAVIMAALHEANETGYSTGKQFRMALPHGSFWFELSVSQKKMPNATNRFIVLSRDITERKKLEASLRESEERQSLAIAASGEGLWDWDIVSDKAYLSQRFCELTGYERDEGMQGSEFFWSLIHPDDVPAGREKLAAQLEGRSTESSVEYRLRQKSGDYKWVRAGGRIVGWDATGNPTRMIGIIADIHERKLVEDRLKQSERRLAEAQRISGLGSWELCFDTNSLTWSDEISRILEIEKDQLGITFDTVLRATHPDDREAVENAYANSIATRTPCKIEHRLLMPDGRIKWVAEQCETHFDAAGKPLRSFGTIHDITRHKQALLALADSEQFNRNLIDAMQDGLVVINTHAIQVNVNPAFCTMTGFSREELVRQMAPFCYWPPEHQKNLDIAFQKTLRGEINRFELTFMRKNGERFPVIASAFPISDNGGRIVAYAATIKDITERMQMETKLRQHGLRLTEAHRIAKLGAWELNLETKIRWWSEEQYYINGITPGTPPTQELFESLIYPDDRVLIAEGVRTTIANGSWEAEYRLMRPDGQLRIIHGRASASYDADGKPLRISGTNRDITETKEMQRALQESEERYRTMIAGLLDGVVLSAGKSLRILSQNDRALELLGLTEEQLLRLEPFDLHWRIIREDGTQFPIRQHPTLQARATRKSIMNVVMGVYRPAKKDLAWLRVNANPVLDEKGRVKQVITTFSDTTAQKRLELAQRAAGAGTWDWDMLHEQMSWSRDLFTIFGLDAVSDQPSFATWQQIIHPDEREKAASNIEQAIKKKIPLTNEYRILRPDGEVRWINALGNTVYDHTGQPVRMTGICIDITERKNAELKISRIYHELQTMKFAMDEHSIVGTTDARGIITYANDRFCQISGYSREELIGRTHVIINSGHHSPDFFRDLWQTISSGMVWQGELCNRKKNGEIYWVETSIVPVLDPVSKKPSQYIGIRTDITQRKKFLDSLNRSLQEKEMLLAEVHHRVKNNLQVISSLISMQSHLIKDKDALMHLSSLSLRIRAMGLLHTKLYKSTDIGRVDMKDYLTAIIEQVLSAQRQNAKRVAMSIDIEQVYLNIETSLPIGLIVNEIISNSLKYAFSAVDSPTLSVSLKFGDGKFRLEICDNGPGLPANIDTKLSLGMRLIQVLAKQLHGTVQILSDNGACFHIAFEEQSKEEKRWERD